MNEPRRSEGHVHRRCSRRVGKKKEESFQTLIQYFCKIGMLPSKLSIFSLAIIGIPIYLLPATAESKCVNYWINPATGNQECLRNIRRRSTVKRQRNYQQQQIINPTRDSRVKYRTIPNRYENDRIDKTEWKSDDLNIRKSNFPSHFHQHHTWPLGYENHYLIQPRVEINIDGYYVTPRVWRKRRFKRDFRRRRYHHQIHPNYYPNHPSFDSRFHHSNYRKNRLKRNSYPNNSLFDSQFHHGNYPRNRFINRRDFYRD